MIRNRRSKQAPFSSFSPNAPENDHVKLTFSDQSLQGKNTWYVYQHPGTRFPDELYQYCEDHGPDRHAPTVLQKIVQNYGFKDTFSTTASFAAVKEWLIQGNPVVVHGYFTPSGHIVVITGYNAKGFVVNDPYGELMYNAGNSYYDTYSSGSGLTYSYNLMYNTCCGGNEFWTHFISR